MSLAAAGVPLGSKDEQGRTGMLSSHTDLVWILTRAEFGGGLHFFSLLASLLSGLILIALLRTV